MKSNIELALVARVGEARVPVLVAAVNDPDVLDEVLRRAIATAIVRAGTGDSAFYIRQRPDVVM